MVHRIVWRVTSTGALEFWQARLGAHGVIGELDGDSLVFADPEGLEHEFVVSSSDDPPLRASAPGIPGEHALQGFDGVRAYSADPARSAGLLLDTLGFTTTDGQSWELRGDSRGSFYAYDPVPPEAVPSQGAGTVHHVAFASQPQDEEGWQARVAEAGARPTHVIDRFYFRSVYFREPSGVLFEIATIGPGFAVDEDAEHLGERLSLPPDFESLRGRLEGLLTPLPYPRPAAD
jgi:glyoxalase family protein